MMKNYLLDTHFLKQLDYNQEKETYVRIISLTNEDKPIEEIIGRVTGGSVNVDGASAVRRTCSLSLVALESDEKINDAYWCYNTKFKLEIGVRNFVNTKYPDIIWFNMGVYIITSFSKSKTTNSLSISISGKDKMCRLNGEVGGNISAQWDFGQIENIDSDGNITLTKLTIYEIIKQSVSQYGQERLENIVINDLDEHGWELWEYRGDQPMYLFLDNSNKKVLNMTFSGSTKVTIASSGETYALKELGNGEVKFQFYSLNTLDSDYNNNASKIKWSNNSTCYVAKIETGDTAGYHQTPLVYGSDLILNAGETLTSLLDKLKAMLGEFEYFYDLDGHFVFQKKKNYIQELFSPINGEVTQPIMVVSPYSYKFDDEKLFTNISENPQINNVKNDFVIWGNRKGATGTDVPIHIRYAIDKKPTRYYSPWQGKEYNDTNWDWREVLYQMTIDYYKHNQDVDFLLQIENYNPQFVNGKTGYEQYYVDFQGFWRQIYNPLITDNDEAIAKAGKFEYYTEGPDKYWNKQIHGDPAALNFWFDFLDVNENTELSKYAVSKIGDRTKVDNNTSVKSIYFKETPEVQFVVMPTDQYDTTKAVYSPIWIQENMKELFVRSTQGLSAIQRANELIAQHTTMSESISLTTIPIYYLQPNTRIYIKDRGDYVLTKISYQLSYNGTMNLSGTKIMKQFY